jgi:hypothetical protein
MSDFGCGYGGFYLAQGNRMVPKDTDVAVVRLSQKHVRIEAES